MDIIQINELWTKGTHAQEQYELTLMKMVIVPLIRRSIFSILNLSMNNECLYKILHHSYHAQDFFKSKVLNKIQLTTSPYKLINYKS
jgi:hypothetical protein